MPHKDPDKRREYRRKTYDPKKEQQKHLKNKEKRNAYAKEWRRQNKDAVNAKRKILNALQSPEEKERWRLRARENWKKWLSTHTEEERFRQKTQMRIRKWGLNIEKYDALVSNQDGLCAICEKLMTPPHIDHDHQTQAFRGLLCFQCNVGLGHFGDSPELLRKAAEYLMRSYFQPLPPLKMVPSLVAHQKRTKKAS